MNLTRYKKWAVLALALANGFFAAAQSNGVPGPADYGRFTSFITARNIFDPNRYARDNSRPYRPNRVQRSAPTFTLVGTMSYEKGLFAFFDGNDSGLRKVIYQAETNNIAGFTLSEITPGGVTLLAADKKRKVQLKIGDSMRQEGSEWQLAGAGELTESSTVSAAGSASAADSSASDTGSPPSSAGAPNDILKKLMQKREQELK
jgi:hypothetical protein